MSRRITPRRLLVALWLVLSPLVLHAAELALTIDGTSPGRVFEGVGALSAGASSRLLIDYPAPQRSEILDFLFKPNFGANLHHLKVEIGGDVNSTDGSEPSHAANREEFLHPKPEYFQRGYEWWLMKEAKKRNPAILLEGLQWGAPGWIGGGRFYTQDNADFIVAFIKGAKEHHGLDMDYQGIWNEMMYDPAYIKLLRWTLDAHGLQRVKITAADLHKPEEKWLIAADAAKDPELMAAIATFNAHHAHSIAFRTLQVARDSGKPLWDGEAHAYGGDWYAAANHIRYNLRSYPVGQITKVISWSLISSYHDFLPVPRSGMMLANTPWCGHYEVQPPLWMLAHVNQFAAPGWRYLDRSCRFYEREGGLQEGLSMVSLRAPHGDDYSVIIETMDMKEPHRLTFTVKGGLSAKDLACWQSSFKGELFARGTDVPVKNGMFVLDLVPNRVYSLTTTRGQRKGEPAHAIPERKPFPFPFTADFEETALHQPGRFFTDMHGTFMVSERTDGAGRCLRQTITRQGIPWGSQSRAWAPQTIIGEPSWRNYRVEVEVQLSGSGQAIIYSHARTMRPMKFLLPDLKPSYHGYAFMIDAAGTWRLQAADQDLATGKIPAPGGNWHRAGLTVVRGRVALDWDGKELATVEDSSFSKGLVALGTGWNQACFDNVRVMPVAEQVQVKEPAAMNDGKP